MSFFQSNFLCLKLICLFCLVMSFIVTQPADRTVRMAFITDVTAVRHRNGHEKKTQRRYHTVTAHGLPWLSADNVFYECSDGNDVHFFLLPNDNDLNFYVNKKYNIPFDFGLHVDDSQPTQCGQSFTIVDTQW